MRAPDPDHLDPARYPAVPIDGGVRVYFVKDGMILGEGRIVGGLQGFHGHNKIEVLPLDARALKMFPDYVKGGRGYIFDRLTGEPHDEGHCKHTRIVSRALVDRGRAPRRFGLHQGA